MTLQDFERNDMLHEYVSKDRFLYENDKVKFWYRIVLTFHEYQPGYVPNTYETRYEVYMQVDDESIHESKKCDFDKQFLFGFMLKQNVKKGKFNEDKAEKIINAALKVNMENKIKKDKYQKIIGITTGTNYFV